MIARSEEQLNPMDYLNRDLEENFHILKEWKKVCEKDFLKFIYITSCFCIF